ncbi:MAG TPA: hypothetical protein VLY20_02690 [Nitrospiria bacterium]|nr:hypothetical protein [Nitrospiria bacterium]
MRRRIPIPASFLLPLVLIFWPGPARAETHVSVTFSVGGVVVIGAGAIFWSFSYTSRVGELRPSQETPDRLSLTTDSSEIKPPRAVQFFPSFFTSVLPPSVPRPVSDGGAPAAGYVPVPTGPRAPSVLELPLWVWRW